MESVIEEKRNANRIYQRAWHEKNRERLNALAREREQKKRQQKLFESHGVYVVPDGFKICTSCRAMKLLDCFYTRKPTKKHPATHRSWCRDCDSRFQHESRELASDYHKNWKLKRNFGITLQQYEAILNSQNNKCAICGREPGQTTMKYRLAVDHCHETGVVRGLLCSDCNIGLGKLGDNVHGLRRALDYLLGVRSK